MSKAPRGCCTGEAHLRNYLFRKANSTASLWVILQCSLPKQPGNQPFLFFMKGLSYDLKKNGRNICHSSCYVILSLSMCASNGMCLFVVTYDKPIQYHEPGRLKHFRTADSFNPQSGRVGDVLKRCYPHFVDQKIEAQRG